MTRAFLLFLAGVALAALPVADSESILHLERSSPGDLEVGGELAGLHRGDGGQPHSTRYIRYEDLLRLPQESYTVSDDSNLPRDTAISGVALNTLARLIGHSQEDALVVAICYDQYRTNYPRDYLAAHHPVLVLRINSRLRDDWPSSQDGGRLGPYLISHPYFKAAFKVLSHEDEPQIPYGVTRIEIRRESVVFGAIRPPREWSPNSFPTSQVEQGYLIARQDCFRCHNMGAEGGTMSGRSWLKLAESANEDGKRFRQTIRNPMSVTPGAKMPAHTDYDDATLDALTAYFKTFATVGRNR